MTIPPNNRGLARRDAYLVAALLVISGNPSVSAIAGGDEIVLSLAAVVMALALLARGTSVARTRLVPVAAALTAIQVLQAFDFGFFPFVTALGLVTRLFLGAAVVAMAADFSMAYVRAMVAIAIYALIMYAVDQTFLQLGGGFRELFEPLEEVIGIQADHHFALVYTFTENAGTHRNAAFFREPGLFAGYLLLAILFVVLRAKDLERGERNRYLAVLIVALASTFSTAGYVTLPLVLAASAFRSHERRHHRAPRKRVVLAVLALSVGAVWLVSQNSDFIADKVLHQYETFLDEGRGYEITRLGAAYLDAQAIRERPLTGWGLHESTRFSMTPELAELFPSGGVTGWARSYGLLGLGVLMWSLVLALRSISGTRGVGALYVTVVVLLIVQPNTFLNFPFFMGLMLLPSRCTSQTPPHHVAEPCSPHAPPTG